MNDSNHWKILLELAEADQRLINGQGTEVLVMVTSDCLPSHPAKDRRASDLLVECTVTPFG